MAIIVFFRIDGSQIGSIKVGQIGFWLENMCENAFFCQGEVNLYSGFVCRSARKIEEIAISILFDAEINTRAILPISDFEGMVEPKALRCVPSVEFLITFTIDQIQTKRPAVGCPFIVLLMGLFFRRI